MEDAFGQPLSGGMPLSASGQHPQACILGTLPDHAAQMSDHGDERMAIKEAGPLKPMLNRLHHLRRCSCTSRWEEISELKNALDYQA
eukprot:3889175-Amphidinium_carterae.1